MRLWKAIVLLNLALLLGLGGGYLWWAREVRALRQELAAARQVLAARQTGTPRSWQVRGIVRFAVPALGGIFLTHETIPGLMEGMTMGFEVADPRVLDGLRPGDRVRFTLAEQGSRLLVVAIEREPDR